MQHTGTLYLSKTRPQASTAADGTFQLQLFAFDRQGPHQVEPWRLVWTGEVAEAFLLRNGSELMPGTALSVQANRARAHIAGRAGAEIVAHVICCEIAPSRTSGVNLQLSTQEQTA